MEHFDRQIRSFLKIAELGSLSRASDVLDLTQSAISRQLASLETYLGKPLFQRTGRGVELTKAGERLFEIARPSFSSLDNVLNTIRDREGITEGQLRLAVVHTLSYYFMAEVVAEFISKREHVNLSLMGRSSPEVVSLVKSGKADIGFVYDTAFDAGELASVAMFEDEMCLVAPFEADIPEQADLTGMRLKTVAFPQHYALRRMFTTSHLDLDVVAEAETIDAMLKLVASRVGVCILPLRLPDKLLGNYGLKKFLIDRPRLRRRVIAIFRTGKRGSPLVDELIVTALSKTR